MAVSVIPRRITIAGAHRSLTIRRRPLVMGILNVTPDSFSDGGTHAGLQQAVARGVRMAAEGADLIDVGGESTRPGAAPVALAEELRRTVPVIRALAREVRIPISIDTMKADVAQRAIDAGASLINDVSALRADPAMARTAASTRAAVILMHMQGSPRTMQIRPRYRDVVAEVGAFLRAQARQAQDAGIRKDRILIDPGIGFGKTVAHNLELMRRLSELVRLGWPLVVGPSRKSFIGKTLNAAVEERLVGTLACVASVWHSGAHIVRVHDVKDTVQMIRMLNAIGTAHAPRRQH